jgi:hypothetical protein
MTTIPMPDRYCLRCAYGTECNCDYYVDWQLTPSPPSSVAKVGLRHSGWIEGFRHASRAFVAELRAVWTATCPDCRPQVARLADTYRQEAKAA